MAELSASDRQELSRIVGEALISEQPDALRMETTESAGAKDLFCQHWPMIKSVLKFIAGQIGGIGWAIKALIAAGDFLHGRLCN